jgi:hypothetical protein
VFDRLDTQRFDRRRIDRIRSSASACVVERVRSTVDRLAVAGNGFLRLAGGRRDHLASMPAGPVRLSPKFTVALAAARLKSIIRCFD